jgi:hypothetical protein
MKKEKSVSGWKVFNKNLKCRNFQYEVGKRYKEEGEPVLCNHGFHFHLNRSDLFEYYDFNPENRVCEIIAFGKVVSDEKKSCCNDIEIVRELSWNDVLNLVNTGKGNTGRNNSGDLNSGDLNSGDLNSGDLNSGNRNSGNRNSGVFNKTNFCSGVFNSSEQPVSVFNGAATVMMSEFIKSKAYQVITGNDFPLTEWVNESNMTDQEKKDHPEFFVMEGYLKANTYEYACGKWWESLSDSDRKVITEIPEFSKEIFYEITGIQID